MSYWIVVVDDEPLSLTNAKNLLRANDMRVNCIRSGKEMLQFMENHTPDLILLDVLMPEMDGFETYRALRQFEEETSRPATPVIFLTGEDSSETERRGLKVGASDFIHKPFDEDVLIKRINNTIVNSKTIESLTEKATHDKLTGFLNKASGTEKVSELCKHASGVLVIMDLDSFKLVNDFFGHDMGDHVLEAFAGVVRLNVRSYDMVCRIGGDEFMGFFSDITREEVVASFTSRLNEQFLMEAEKLMGADHGIPLGISLGAAYCNEEMKDYQSLFQCADSALYEVKRNGKHGYKIYDPNVPSDGTEDDIERELQRVTKIMAERDEGKGAVILGQDAFASNYRFIERFISRYGGVATRILFSVDAEDQKILLPEMVAEFGTVLTDTIRKTDIIMQWQQRYYFVVLPLLSNEDAETVIRRVLKNWEAKGHDDKVSIKYAVSTLYKQLGMD